MCSEARRSMFQVEVQSFFLELAFQELSWGVFQKSKNPSGWCRNSGGLGIFLTTQVA